MKNILIQLAFLLIGYCAIAQQNTFYSGDFWKTSPSLNEVKSLIEKGNDPVSMNQNGFDATVYAIIRHANNDVIEHLLSIEGNIPNKKTHDSRNYLHWAAYSGNVTIVKQLLKLGSSVTQPDSHGNTPLMFAANAGKKDPAIYDAFKNHGVDIVNEKNEEGATILLALAPHLENEKELSTFLSYGLKLKTVDNDGNNIFHYAAKKGNLSFLQVLIDKGVDFKATNKNGSNAILMASSGARNYQNTQEVYTFLENLGVDVNVVGDNGRNPLHNIAYRNTDLDLFTYFLDHGVDVNLKDDNGNSPFMNAAASNSLKVVQFLSKKVTDINAHNSAGNTALTMAVSRNNAAVVEFLLAQKANAQVKDNKGNNLAYYLVHSYNSRNTEDFKTKMKLLQSQKVSMTATQSGGNTLYHMATGENDLKLIQLLENLKIDINKKNEEGLTALHIAAMKAKDDKIIKYLIDKGADLKLTTDFEESVYELAMENEILQKNNTSLNFLK